MGSGDLVCLTIFHGQATHFERFTSARVWRTTVATTQTGCAKGNNTEEGRTWIQTSLNDNPTRRKHTLGLRDFVTVESMTLQNEPYSLHGSMQTRETIQPVITVHPRSRGGASRD